MTTDNDTEDAARANLAQFYTVIDEIMANTRRRTVVESLILDGFCAGSDGLAQFGNAHELAADFCSGYAWSRLTHDDVLKIDAMIQLARTLRGSRHVAQNDEGAPVLLGSNGVVQISGPARTGSCSSSQVDNEGRVVRYAEGPLSVRIVDGGD